MKYEFYRTDSKGYQLQVLQTIPGKGDRFPTVVMVPGFGMDLHENGYFDQMSSILVKNGYQTVRFSFSGTGTSGGHFRQTTVDRQAQELRDIISFAAHDRFTNTEHIALVAHGFGAISTIVSLLLPEIKTFVFTGTLVHPQDSLAKWYRRQRGFDPKGISEREGIENKKVAVEPEFWRSLSRHTLKGRIKSLDQSILFIHGGRDQRSKAFEAEELYEAVSVKKRFHMIEKADHAFTGDFRPVVFDLIVDWLSETV